MFDVIMAGCGPTGAILATELRHVQVVVVGDGALGAASPPRRTASCALHHRRERLAAHNYGLRIWLRSGAGGDVASAVDHALDLVHRTWGETGETLVVVARTTTPIGQIVQRIESLRTERGRADTE